MLIDYVEFITDAAERVELLNEYNLKVSLQILDENCDGIFDSQMIKTAFALITLTELQLLD